MVIAELFLMRSGGGIFVNIFPLRRISVICGHIVYEAICVGWDNVY